MKIVENYEDEDSKELRGDPDMMEDVAMYDLEEEQVRMLQGRLLLTPIKIEYKRHVPSSFHGHAHGPTHHHGHHQQSGWGWNQGWNAGWGGHQTHGHGHGWPKNPETEYHTTKSKIYY